MTQKPKMSKRNLTVIAGIVCIAIIAGVSLGLMTYFSDANRNNPKTQDTLVPKLVTSGMQYQDNRTDANAPFLHVTGTITNEGNATAKSCTLHMVAIQNANVTAIDKTVNIDPIAAGATQPIDLTFAYTGDALLAYNSPTLDWTN